MKNFLFLFLAITIASCTQPKVTFNMTSPVELEAHDSLKISVNNPKNRPVTYRTSNEYVAYLKNGVIKAMFQGTAMVYAETEDGVVDSLAVSVNTDNALNMVKPYFDFNASIDDVMEYERNAGLNPKDMVSYNSALQKETHRITSPRMVARTKIEDFYYFFSPEGEMKVIAFSIPMSSVELEIQAMNYLLTRGMGAFSLGNSVSVFYVFNGQESEEYETKLKVLREGRFLSPIVKDQLCVAVINDANSMIFMYFLAQDAESFPMYTIFR